MRFQHKNLLGGAATFALISTISTVVIHAKTYTNTVSNTEADPVISLIIFGCFLCCFGFLYAGVPIFSAIVVYRDAKKNHVENYWLWVLIVLLGIPFTMGVTLIGLVVYYLAIRPPYLQKKS